MRQGTELQTNLTGRGTSPWRSYRRLVAGDRGLLYFLYLEGVTTLLGNLPGLLGLGLRSIFYRPLFGSFGRKVALGRGVTLRQPHRIRLGSRVIVDDYAVLDAKGTSAEGIDVGEGTVVNRGAVLSCKGGKIAVGAGCNIGQLSILHSESSIVLEEHCLLAAYCYLVAGGNHDFSRTDMPVILQPSISKGGIRLQHGVWLGADVTVMDGVTVGHDAVVGAKSLVTADIPPLTVAVGTPARVTRSRTP